MAQLSKVLEIAEGILDRKLTDAEMQYGARIAKGTQDDESAARILVDLVLDNEAPPEDGELAARGYVGIGGDQVREVKPL